MQERESIIFITKDAFCKDYLPCYGNQYWSGHTPNIDKLVENGSVFRKYYTGVGQFQLYFKISLVFDGEEAGGNNAMD